MASNTDPSIYRDRSTIGSSDELDEYGVWVKSEPQDLTSDVKAEVPLAEPSLPDIEDLPDLELDSNDLMGPPVEDIPLDTEEVFSIPESEPVSAVSNDVDLQDFDSDSFSVEDSLPALEAEAEETIDVNSFMDFEEISQAKTVEASSPKEAGTDEFAELSMDDFLGDSDFSAESSPLSPAEEETEEESNLDIDLTFQDHQEPVQEDTPEIVDFDFSVADESAEIKTSPADEAPIETVSDFDDFLNELSDSDAPVSSPKPVAPAAEDTALDDFEDIHLDVEETEGLDSTFSSSGSSEEDSGIDLNVSLEDDFESSINLSSSEEKADKLFESVDSITKEIQEEVIAPAPEAPKAEAEANLSTQLLLKIADELSSIKGELASLKDELSVLRSETKTEQASKTAEAESASHGFFDEEDDEKIALTGDELDNILNTADFTEEAGADAGEEVSDELDLGFIEEGATVSDLTDDLDLSSKPDILGENEPEPAIERIDLPSSETEEPEALKQLREEGVQPMSPPPEDTSYLENEELSIEDIDLTEAVIEEPDLGGMMLEENKIEEPSIDSIDFDEMPLHVESLSEESVQQEEESNLELDDISITLDDNEDDISEQPHAEESFAEVIPEQFVIEADSSENAMPSIDESIEMIPETEESEPVQENVLEEISSSEPALPGNLRQEVKAVLSYMDQLLESLPEDKIEEFAQSEYFETYKKLFEELGLS